jgi:hypothetical protein
MIAWGFWHLPLLEYLHSPTGWDPGFISSLELHPHPAVIASGGCSAHPNHQQVVQLHDTRQSPLCLRHLIRYVQIVALLRYAWECLHVGTTDWIRPPAQIRGNSVPFGVYDGKPRNNFQTGAHTGWCNCHVSSVPGFRIYDWTFIYLFNLA